MESDGINNGLISYQLSIEGSSFEALLDTEDDSVFNEKMESDGNNNVFNSNQLGYSDLNPLKSNDGGSLEIPLQQQQQAMLGVNERWDSWLSISTSKAQLLLLFNSIDLSTEGSSFDSLLDTEDDSVFDAMMGSDGINNVFISNQLGYLDLNPLKRYLSSLYCIEFKNETTWPCNSKRFQGNSNDGGILEIPLQQQQ
ncbi:hypothetical protein V6N11_021917 [Hibiscus sabdariffa]|uniref:Uncharacterized protein n=1 Tax=Hibiscus sabdariffa TaxID=183260 RepID=A0ABR2TIB7_9ROSI